MLPRVICPFHKEDTASCVVYPEGHFHCFGCGKHGEVSELKGVKVDAVAVRPKEDIGKSIERIKSLPIGNIRGLPLHHDADSYYVVWPDSTYYKRRFKSLEGDRSKYLSPTGVNKPQLVYKNFPSTSVCIVVEGELNALSIREAVRDVDVVCPGGSGDFYSKTMEKELHKFRGYDRLVVLVDDDPAGFTAAVKFKSMALKMVPQVDTFFMKQDANEVLEKEGKEALRTKIQAYLDLS